MNGLVWQFDNKNAKELPENADLKADIYKTPGVYVCSSTNKALKMVNCPASNAFTLFVYRSIGTGNSPYIIQEFREVNGKNFYKRAWIADSVSFWNNDIKYVTNEDLNHKNLPSTDLNNVVTPGEYLVDYQLSILTNAPNVESAYFSGIFRVNATSDGALITQSFEGVDYCAYRRKFYSTEWKPWKIL